MNRIFIGTRKGLFAVDVSDDGVADKPELLGFLGVPVTIVFPDGRDGSLYAALDHGHFGVKLHRSENGNSWTECGVPAYPQADDDEKENAPALNEIWALEAAGPDRPDSLWCGTIPGGLFRSDDRGESWQLVESLWNRPERAEWMGGGKDHAGIHSICVDPRNSESVAVGVSIGGVWATKDGGQAWSQRADGMRAEYMPPERQFDGNVQDAHLLVRCRDEPDKLWVQHHNGIFRTTNNCDSWQEITEPGVSGFGFAVAVDPGAGDTAWFVPAVKDECRVPVDGKFVTTRTRDGGTTFDVLSNGLPTEQSWDIVFRHALAIDSSGKRLAMGSSTGSFWISTDAGDSWQCITTHLPQIYCVRFGE